MTNASSVSGFVPGLSKVLARFPVCVLASVALCIVANAEIAGLVGLDEPARARLYPGLISMFLAGGVGHLFAEGRGWSGFQDIAFALGLAGLAGIGFVLGPAAALDPLFLIPGLILLVMVAAYASRAARPEAFWLFSARLAIAVVVATGVGVLFGAGVWAVINAYDYLFPPGIDVRWEEHAWATAVTLVGPLCGLSLIQGRLDEGVDPVGDPTLFGRVVSILAAWVLVPIVIVAALLLHAYAARIAWQGRLPDNEIGATVLAYLIGGTAAWLVVQPWAERGNRLLRWFAAAWLRLAIIPTVLLVAAVVSRIWAYGVLPERYGLALMAAWMFAVAAYAAWIRGRPDPRVAVGGLGLLLVAGAFGPWGATGLSVWNQTNRLVGILETHGMVVDGRLVARNADRQDLDVDTSRDAASIVAFLDRVGALDRLAPIAGAPPEDAAVAGRGQRLQKDQVVQQLGIGAGQTPESEAAGYIEFAADSPAVLATAGPGALFGPITATAYGPAEGRDAWFDGSGLTVRYGDNEWRVDSSAVADAVRGPVSPGGARGPVVIDLPGERPAKLIVTAARVRDGHPVRLWMVTGWLVVPDGQQ